MVLVKELISLFTRDQFIGNLHIEGQNNQETYAANGKET